MNSLQFNAPSSHTEANDMPKAKAAAIAFMRWTPDEYLKVAVNALQYIAEGMPVVESFIKAQRVVLPRNRWRTLKGLNSQTRATFREYAEKARKLGDKQKAALMVVAQEKPEPDAQPEPEAPTDTKRHAIRWNTLEKAQVAREVIRLRSEQPSRTLGPLVIDAQKVLPTDRQRSKQALYVAATDRHQHLKKDIDEGVKNIFVLEKHERAEAERVANAERERQHREHQQHQQQLLKQQQEVARAAAFEFQAPEAPAPVAAPTPAPSFQSTLGDACAAFGVRMQEHLSELLQAAMVHAVNTLGARIDAVSNQVGLSIAAQIQRGLQGTVHDLLTQELGGPVAAPAPAPAPAAAPVAAPVPDASKGPRLKVDVVGLIGANIQQVREAFNGHTDLRFIDVDQVARWDVRKDSSVVVVTKFVSHKVTDKIKQAGLKPIHVNGGAPVVIHAIEELHRVQGVPV